MATILKSIHRIGEKFDRIAERFVFHHPYISHFLMFIIMPILILACVVLCTMLIAVPMCWLFGWA